MLRDLNIYQQKFCEFVYRLMIFLAVFDGIRSKTPIADYVTFFKEISTFTLFIIVIVTSTSIIKKRVLYFSNIFLVIYLVFIATVVITFNDLSRFSIPTLIRNEMPAPFAMHFKNIEAFIVIFVLIHYEHLTGKRISTLMDYFVKLCIIYIIFTLIIYFKFDNTTFFKMPWYGRISIGYPTCDAQILSFGLAYLVFGKNKNAGAFRGIYIGILILGIIMNATSTGLLSVLVIFSSYFIYYIFSGNFFSIFSLKNYIYVIIALLIFFTGGVVLGKLNDKVGDYASLLDTKMSFVTNKIGATLFGKYNPEFYPDISEELRQNQIDLTFQYRKDNLSVLFGGPISLGTFIENENYFLLRSYGYFGFALYYLWIIMLLMYCTANFKRYYSRVFVMSIAILIITNSAITTTYLFGIAVTFGLFVAYFFYNSSKGYHDEIEAEA